MSRPGLTRPITSEGLNDKPRTTNFSRPIAPARSQSTSHDLLNPPNFNLNITSPKSPEKESTSKDAYVPHLRISEEDEEKPQYRPFLRLEDDDSEDDEVDGSVEESIGTTDTSNPSYESNPPTSSTENTTATTLSDPLLTSSKPTTHLSPSKSRPAAFASDSYNSISSTTSAAPKPLNIRPPTSKYARASGPRLETIPSASPPDRFPVTSPSHHPEPVIDAAPSPSIPSRRHPPLTSPELDGDSDPDSAAPPSIPTRRRPHIVKRVSLEQKSERESPATTPGHPQPQHYRFDPDAADDDDEFGDKLFGVQSHVSHQRSSRDLEFEAGAFPDPFDTASRISIDTEALEPYDAPELPATTNPTTTTTLPYRESNSSSRGSAHRSSSDVSSWSGGSWSGGRHPVESLSEKEIAKLRKKGINPELFAEMREARRKAHGKRARLVGPLVGSTFVG